MELKDIVLKKNDIVYYDDDYLIVDGLDGKTADEVEGFVSKIERPVKYETIYEALEEKLNKEEKKYLEAVLRPYPRDVIIKKMCGYFNHYIVIEFKDSNNIRFPITLNSFQFQYEGMELNKEYTLDELGLFKE